MGSDDTSKLDEIIKYLKELNTKIDKTEERLLEQMKDIAQSTGREIKEIKQENKILVEKIEIQEKKIAQLENENRKNNVVIFGIEETEETMYDLEDTVKELLTKKLNMSIDNSDVNYVTRMGKKQDQSRPILLSCTTWRMKKEILKNKATLRNSKITIKEDFSKEVREERRELGKLMMKIREEGKQATIRGTKLLVDGIYYNKEDLKKYQNITTISEDANANKRPRSEERHNNANSKVGRLDTASSSGIVKSVDPAPNTSVITSFFEKLNRPPQYRKLSQ